MMTESRILCIINSLGTVDMGQRFGIFGIMVIW
jgi:hypothetical protein